MGQESEPITLPGAPSYLENLLTLKLDKINRDPSTARLMVLKDNDLRYSDVVKGMKPFVGSSWQVEEIFSDAISFVDEDGNKELLKTSKGVKSDPCIGSVSGSEASFCEAIENAKKAIEETTDNSKIYEGYIQIAEVYSKMGVHSEAVRYYEEAKSIKSSDFEKNYGNSLKEAKESAEKNLISVYLDGSKVSLLNTYLESNKVDGVTAIIDGVESEYELNQDLIKGCYEDGRRYEWEIIGINSEDIVIQQDLRDGKQRTLTVGITEGVPCSEGGTKYVEVKKVDLIRSAIITVSPGSKKNYGVSNFIIHLPIEKRLIQWTPEEIDDMIESTDKTMDKLDNIINRLSNVIKTWKGLCIAVFGFLSVKNAFFKNPMARRLTVEKFELDCKEKVEDKLYGSIDDCLDDHEDEIEAAVKVSEKAVDKTKDIMDGFKWSKENSVSKAANQINEFSSDQLSVMEEYGDLTAEEVRDLIYYKQMGYDTSEIVQDWQERLDNSEKIKSAWEKVEGYKEKEDQEKAQILYRIRRGIESEKVTGTVGTYAEDEDKAAKARLKELYGENQALVSGEVYVYEGLNNEVYVYDELGKKITLEPITKSNADSNILSSKSKGSFYYGNNGKIYLASLSEGGYALEFAHPPRIDYDGDSKKPIRIPFEGGGNYKTIPNNLKGGANYILVNEDSNVYPYSVWNAGPDRQMGTFDDTLIVSESMLKEKRQSADLQRLDNQIRSIYDQANVGIKEGQEIKVAGKPYIAQVIEKESQSAMDQCRYFMSSTDCKILFGVCDPVMCPASRFDLGGRWDVDSAGTVVEKGIIGSLVLGLPNFDIPYEPVPICLTGINAGLENIYSMFGSFRDCLETAKVSGESVGICNEIRSLYICDILWEEAFALVNVFGKLSNIISDKILGREKVRGDLGWTSDWNQLGQTVSFFTKDYAKSAFAAFNSRSTKEIGTAICKKAIFGKYPAGGDLLAQLTEPESPPQFTGWFEEDKYTEVEGGKSAYRIYYHIYAGRTSDVRYRVYLQDYLGRSLPVTNEVGLVAGERLLRKGESVDKSFTITADPGFSQMCIVVNGRTECGFGSVSSSFSMNYLKGELIKKELEEDINTAEECIPDDPHYVSAPVSLTIGQATSKVRQSGIKRVCSPYDPDGAGDDWEYIGSCGTDEEGKSLGMCWIYAKGINLNDLSYNLEGKLAGIPKPDLEYDKLDETESESAFKQIISDTSISPKDRIRQLFTLIQDTISNEVRSESYLEISKLYVVIGEEAAEAERIERQVALLAEIQRRLAEEKTIVQEGESVDCKIEYRIPVNNMIEFEFIDGEWVYIYSDDGYARKECEDIWSYPAFLDSQSSASDYFSNLCYEVIGKDFSEGVQDLVKWQQLHGPGDDNDYINVVDPKGKEHKIESIEASYESIVGICLGESVSARIIEDPEINPIIDKRIAIRCDSGSYNLHLNYGVLTKEGDTVQYDGKEDLIDNIYYECYAAEKIEIKQRDEGYTYELHKKSVEAYNIDVRDWIENAVFMGVKDNHYPFELKLNKNNGGKIWERIEGLFEHDITLHWNGFELQKVEITSSQDPERYYNVPNWDEGSPNFFDTLVEYWTKGGVEQVEFKCMFSDYEKKVKSSTIKNQDYLKSFVESNAAKCKTGLSITSISTGCEKYKDWIEELSNEYGVDPNLVLALIEQESRCNQEKVGLTGDYGLMQITEPTAMDICKPAGIIDEFYEVISDPEKNLACGIKILTEYHSKYEDGFTYNACDPDNTRTYYKGWDAALRAYNGGTCNPDYPSQDNYVDNVNNIYEQITLLYRDIDYYEETIPNSAEVRLDFSVEINERDIKWVYEKEKNKWVSYLWSGTDWDVYQYNLGYSGGLKEIYSEITYHPEVEQAWIRVMCDGNEEDIRSGYSSLEDSDSFSKLVNGLCN